MRALLKNLERLIRQHADLIVIIAALIWSGSLAWLLLTSISPVQINLSGVGTTPMTIPPNSLITVDADHWRTTSDLVARAYGEACNKALAINYGGDYGDTKGYICVPVRGVVYLKRKGRTIGEPVRVRLLWEGER